MTRTFNHITAFIVLTCVASMATGQPIGSPDMNGPDSPQRDMVALEAMNNAAYVRAAAAARGARARPASPLPHPGAGASAR